jgi:hypothetical protein
MVFKLAQMAPAAAAARLVAMLLAVAELVRFDPGSRAETAGRRNVPSMPLR